MDKINDTTIRLLSMNDIKKPGRLIAKTGDINGRDLYVQMEGDACRGLNTEGVRLTLAYKTPSGKVGEILFENVDGEEGIFKVTLGEEVTSSAGIVTLAIRVNMGGRLVETPNFDLYVEGSPFVGTIAQPEEPEPEPEIPTLDGIEYTHEYEEDKHDVIYIETDRLYLGEEEVIQFPQKGEYYIIYGEFYNGDELLKREEVYRIEVKERLDYIIEVGTKVRVEPVKPEEPEEDYEYRDLPDGTVEITKYNGNDSDRLEVPETLGGKEVSSIGVGAYEGKSFKWVIITGNIKNIGDFAFKDSKTIEGVDFNGYVERIGEESFKGNNMVRVVIPKGVKFIGKDAFEDNSRSREGGMFEILAERGTVAEDYAKEYGYEFREFREIVEPEEGYEYRDLPDGTVEITGYDGDPYIHELYIPQKLGGKAVSVIGEGVFEMMDIYTLQIPEGVTTIKDFAFRENIYLLQVEFPESLEYIGNQAFEGTDISRLGIWGGRGNLKHIGNEAFKGSSLDHVDLNRLEYIGDRAFMGNNIGEMYFEYDDVYIGEDAFLGNPGRGLEYTFAIHGNPGSNAEKYAMENGHQFFGY